MNCATLRVTSATLAAGRVYPAAETGMSMLIHWMKWQVPKKRACLYMQLALLAVAVGGCMTREAESDLQWKQYNPNWKSPTPEDPQRWGVPF